MKALTRPLNLRTMNATRLVHGSFAGWNQYEPLAVPSGIDAVVETDTRDVQIGGYPMSAACAAPLGISAVTRSFQSKEQLSH